MIDLGLFFLFFVLFVAGLTEVKIFHSYGILNEPKFRKNKLICKDFHTQPSPEFTI